MDSNKIEGAANEAIGHLQDGIGGLSGDTVTEAKGKARALGGQAQGYYGDALDTVRDMTADQPLLAVGVAVGVGFLIGAVLARL